ncbi:hypothetical protein V8G54_030768, partial [Vigna mungo]
MRNGSRVSKAINLLRLKRMLKTFPESLLPLTSRNVIYPSFCKCRTVTTWHIYCTGIKQKTIKKSNDTRIRTKRNLWSNHIYNLTQYIFKKHGLLGHALHPMQLLLIKELHFIWCQHSIS